jgi:methylisocitrate lyase
MPASDDARIRSFRALHGAGCFVMPNPWDPGSARMLAALGFQALATTSAGMAWALGHRDNDVSRDEVLAHLATMAAAVDVPINADFEGGFAVAPGDVAANVRLAADTGIAGLSIEDSTGDPSAPLFDRGLAVERVRAAREALDASGSGVLLTARSEGFFVGRPDLDETVARLAAYAEAGAECLYAPGITTPEQIAAVVAALAPKPVNLLVHRPFITVAGAAALGVRRISVGGALARVAWTSALDAARTIAADGTFAAFDTAVSSAAIHALITPKTPDGRRVAPI